VIKKNEMKNFTNRILYGLILVMTAGSISFGQTVVRGVVRDAFTKEPLQSVSIFVEDGKGATTKADGSFVYGQ